MQNLYQSLHPILRGKLRDIQETYPYACRALTIKLQTTYFFDDLTYFDLKIIYSFLLGDDKKAEIYIPDIIDCFKRDGYTIKVVATHKGKFYKADVNGIKITENELLTITGLTGKERVNFDVDIENFAETCQDYKFDIYKIDVS